MSDVIFALKNKKANMETRLESCMKLDEGGVAFFSHPKVALDAMELRADEIRRLLIGLQTVDDYEYIVLDMDFAIDADMLELYSMMQSIVMVGDGSEISNWKISRAYQTFFVLEQVMDTILTDHIVTIYNRFNSTYCKLISGDGPQNIGGAPRYRNVSVRQMVRQLSSMEMFDHIV